MKSLTVSRELSASRINFVVNHPEVRPYVGGVGPLDLAGLVADPRNVLLMVDGGGCLFQWLGEGYYEVHTQFIPEARGAAAIQAVRDALWWMFTATDAVEIVTKVPDTNLGALGLVRAIHGTFQFSRPNAWQNADGALSGVKYYSKTLMDWVRDESEELSKTGDWFHDKLAEAKTRMGASNPPHDDDHAHDRYVGMASEMISRGQLAKGVLTYNRWATFAGYAPVSVLSVDPVIIDVQDALLLVRGGDFEVIYCR
jgi:hypothetical protein